jgi:DNA-binding MarR family transcriptional regulator
LVHPSGFDGDLHAMVDSGCIYNYSIPNSFAQEMTVINRVRQGGFLISKVHQLQGRVFDRLLKEAGGYEINPAQGRVLFVLWQQDSISMQELVEQTALEKSTLTRMVERLEGSGHVVRVPDESDKRKVLVQPTEESRRLQWVYEQVSARMVGIFYDGFLEDEMEQMEHLLQRVLDNLVKREERNKG